MTDNGVSISARVHSPTDWEMALGRLPTFHIGGYSYGKGVNAQGSVVWYKSTDSPQAYQHSPYPGAAAQFAGFANVGGATIVRSAPCSVAGIAGHIWTIGSPARSTLSEGESACVADRSGALLSLTTSARGSAFPKRGLSYSFRMTSVGAIAVIPVPSPVQSP